MALVCACGYRLEISADERQLLAAAGERITCPQCGKSRKLRSQNDAKRAASSPGPTTKTEGLVGCNATQANESETTVATITPIRRLQSSWFAMTMGVGMPILIAVAVLIAGYGTRAPVETEVETEPPKKLSQQPTAKVFGVNPVTEETMAQVRAQQDARAVEQRPAANVPLDSQPPRVAEKERPAQSRRDVPKLTNRKQDYPLNELKPWEKPMQQWSWNQKGRPFTVRPSQVTKTHIKTAVSVEHRYVDIYYPKTSDRRIVEAAAREVWHHFAKEINDRHPQAEYKMVIVYVYLDGQKLTLPAGRVKNEACETLPDNPEIVWNEDVFPTAQ